MEFRSFCPVKPGASGPGEVPGKRPVAMPIRDPSFGLSAKSMRITLQLAEPQRSKVPDYPVMIVA
jgi:hypothetical protein